MTTLKGIFPDTKPVKGKNFIHENVKNLRRMEHSHANKGVSEELQKSRKKTSNNNNYTRDVLSKISSKNNDVNVANSDVNNKIQRREELAKKSSAPTLNKTINVPTKKTIYSTGNNSSTKEKRKESHKSAAKKLQEKVSSDPNFSFKSVEDNDDDKQARVKVKSQGIQTLDAKEIDELYSEGIIRYPSKKYLNDDESMNKTTTEASFHEKTDAPRNVTSSPSDRGDVRTVEKAAHNRNVAKSSKLSPSKEETNFVKLNKEHSCVGNKLSTQLNNCGSNNVLPATYRMGVIPKYIKSRKENQEKVQKAKTEDSDPNCPNGHVPLPETERKETLRMLRKNYQDYVNELNMMPIKVDTLRAQRRKIEIEKQLNKLEEGIKVFSRPKVYVKMNA